METKVLVVEERETVGSANARRVRKTGKIPAVVYSGGEAAKTVALPSHAFHMSTRNAKPTQLYKFESPNSALDGTLVLIKDVQIAAVRGEVIHVDFLALQEGHKIELSVGLELVGEPLSVKENRAVINQVVYEIEIACIPSAIPSIVTVDISSLEENESLHAGDVTLPEGVELISDPTMTVVSALSKKDMEAAAAAAEAAMAAAAPVVAAAPVAAPAAGKVAAGKAAPAAAGKAAPAAAKPAGKK